MTSATPSDSELDIADVYPSPRRRRLIVWACTTLAIALLLWNLPIPKFRPEFRDATGDLYRLALLDQNWALFAPDVSTGSTFVHLEVIRTDGSREVIEFPAGEPWIATYRAYRWSAYEENLLDDELLREDALAYALDTVDDRTTVESVQLVLLESNISTGDHGPFDHVYERSVIAELTP